MHIAKIILKWILGVAFILAGVNHFLDTVFYLNIMPPYLPWHLFLVYISGVFEIALGLLLLIPRSQRIAAWGLILLLVAVFPANIHMALNTHLYPEIDPAFIYLRLPIQFLIIGWAFWFTRKED